MAVTRDPATRSDIAPDLQADAEGIRFHYDLPPAFFKFFLDPTISYSCHYFLTPDTTLAQAALDKLELVARKIELRTDDHVLDVGCGWGSFVLWAAEIYGCRATGITLSPSQAGSSSTAISCSRSSSAACSPTWQGRRHAEPARRVAPANHRPGRLALFRT